LLKAEANRTFTRALKELGVTSTKEFKIAQAQLETDRTNIDTITAQNNTYANEVKELEGKYNNLKQESVLNKLNISDEYREDLTKLALDKVTNEKSFENILTEMTTDKYQYAVTGTSTFRMGSEKNEAVIKSQTSLSKKYSFIKD
jgi:hypothetical protein